MGLRLQGWGRFGTQDLGAWYGKDTQNLVRSPLSRQLQEGTIKAYMSRILKDGLSQKVSGQAIVKWTSDAHGARLFGSHGGLSSPGRGFLPLP